MTGDHSTPVPAAAPGTVRRFGIYDSMISISGIALLLAYENRIFVTLMEQSVLLCKAIAAYYGFISAPYLLTRSMATYWSTVAWYGVQAAELLILIMTAVFLLMRVRRPRPPIRALLRQPGTVAGLAVTLGFVWITGWLHLLFFGRLSDRTVTAVAVGSTVALAWTCLALSRRWEAEPSWVDRMGRLLGVMAIVVGIIAFSVFGL